MIMNKSKFIQTFDNYSEEALNSIINTCVGKPVNDINGLQIGLILSGRRIDNSNNIEFEMVEV